MSDLVKRLRGQRIDGRSTDETMLEAADEIERLRRENERLRKVTDFLRDYIDDCPECSLPEADEEVARLIAQPAAAHPAMCECPIHYITPGCPVHDLTGPLTAP